MAWECGTYWGRQDAYRIMVGTPEGKRTFERLKCKQEDNIKMGFQEMGYKSLNWIDVAQDWDKWWAVLKKVMNLWFALNAGSFFLTASTLLNSQDGTVSVEFYLVG
jgi:hypothetical protein